MWRLNDPRRLYNSVKNDVKRYCTSTNEVFNEAHPHLSILRVVVCTCAAAAFLHEEPLKSQLPSFSHIFIDEAGQVPTD
jgi:superfamily I DNA and/or RNA helicase